MAKNKGNIPQHLVEFYEKEWMDCPYDNLLSIVFNSVQDSIQHIYAICHVLKTHNIKTLAFEWGRNTRRTLITNQHLKLFALALLDTKINTLELRHSNITLGGLKQLLYDLRHSTITCLKINAFIIQCPDFTPFTTLQHTQIRHLSLASCNIDTDGLLTLGPLLVKTVVEELNLGSNSFDEEVLPDFLRMIKKTNVNKLDLSHNNLTNIHRAAWTSALENTPVLSLILNNNYLNGKGLQTLLMDLKNTQVEKLKLRNNGISDTGIQLLGPYLSGTKLKTLSFKMNQITGYGLHKLAMDLRNSQINALSLQGNHIEFRQVDKFLDIVPQTALTHLNLSVIRFSQFTQPSPWLQNLTSLKLNATGLNSDTLEQLAKALAGTQVATLALAMNRIDDNGLKKLFPLLGQTNVVALDLSVNELTDQSIDTFHQLKKPIIELNLNANRFSKDGLVQLASILFLNKKIKKCYFKHRQGLERKHGALIAAMIESNTAPFDLDLVSNGPGAKLITKALKENEQFFILSKNTLISILLQMKISLKLSLRKGIKQNPYLYIQQLDFLLSEKTPPWLKERFVQVIHERFEKYTESLVPEIVLEREANQRAALLQEHTRKQGFFSEWKKNGLNNAQLLTEPKTKSYCSLF